MSESLEALFQKYDTPGEAWKSKEAKREITKEYCEWLSKTCSWSNFLTLTFGDPVKVETAQNRLRRLIQVLNKDAYGKNYVRVVGHSYFNYVAGMEFTTLDVVHFHMLVNKPINYKLVHDWWGSACGFAWITPVKDSEACLGYVLKYVMKAGEENIHLFLGANPKGRNPKKNFSWWNDGNAQ